MTVVEGLDLKNLELKIVLTSMEEGSELKKDKENNNLKYKN